DPLLVINTNDAGAGSLRDAVTYAESHSGADTIRFAVALDGQSITLLNPIYFNGDSTTVTGDIDSDFIPDITLVRGASTNWGFAVNGNHNVISHLNFQQFNTAGILINGHHNHIRGNTIGTNLDGSDNTGTGNTWGIQLVNSAKYNTIGDTVNAGRNIIAGNTGYGIVFQNNSDSNAVIGNYIGLNAAGDNAFGNGTAGIVIDAGPKNNTIGNGLANGRNIISGNNYAVFITGAGANYNRIIGNFIGTDPLGTTAIPNPSGGINIASGAKYNEVGNGTVGGRNVISGNGSYEIVLSNSDSNKISGNYIGLDVTGANGISTAISGISASNVHGTVIGGVQANDRNYFGDAGYGVSFSGGSDNVIRNNSFGSDITGANAIGSATALYFNSSAHRDSVIDNRITRHLSSAVYIQSGDSIVLLGNQIHHNAGPGISMDPGAQSDIASPRIVSIAGDSTLIGKAAPNAFVQVFADSLDEGEFSMGSTLANASGDWSLKVPVATGRQFTALQDSMGRTSAFSAPYTPNFVPTAPTGLFALAFKDSVRLHWNPAPEAFTSKYYIYSDVTSNPTTLVDSTTGGQMDTSKVITALSNGTQYYFRVSAVGPGNSVSAFSNEDAVVPVIEAGNAL
ncbi:MAG TPA: right-handed parallel beta-helix repeat-containing protein, partial [bacterium]|nr:right-handed parallel beta-helix repeat-containing protein [bacterium]